MKAEDQPGFLETLRNGYQWGVHSADTNLGLLITICNLSSLLPLLAPPSR
jgi:hypothetical protein